MREITEDTKKAGGLFFSALIIQLAFLQYFSSIPYFDGISGGFTEVAKNYIEGRGFSEAIFDGEKIAYQPAVWEAPGYSAFITPIFLIFGQNNLYVKLAQAFIYSIVPPAMYLFFRKRLGEKSALLLGVFAAAYIPTMRLSTAILSEFLFGVLLLGSVLLVLDKRYILAGVFFGSAVLTRDFGLMFIPAFFVYFLLNARSKNITHKQFFVFLAAFLIIVSPWMARNYADYGHFAISAPKVGIALWEGIGEYDVDKRFKAPVYDGDVMARENAISFKYPAPFGRDSARVDASLKIIRENPAWYLSVMARRIPQLLFMNTGDQLTSELKRNILHNFNLGIIGKLAGMMLANKSGLLQIFMWMEQAAAYLFAIFGAYYILRRRQAEYFIFPLVAAMPLALLIMHVEPRYFTPTNYFVVFLAIYGMNGSGLFKFWHKQLPGEPEHAGNNMPTDFKKWNEKMFIKYNNERMYYHPNPAIRYIENKRVNIIERLLSGEKYKKILEIGCGEGYILNKFSGKNLTGIDISRTAIERAKEKLKNKDARLLVRNAETLKMNEFFDGIILSEVLEHVPHPEKVIESAAKLSHKTTKIVITIPNEKMINRIKDFAKKSHIFKLVFPNISERMDWHLHEFDMTLLKQVTADYLVIEKTYPIPSSVLPVRYVAECRITG